MVLQWVFHFTEDEMKWVDELMSLETFRKLLNSLTAFMTFVRKVNMADDHVDMFSSDGYGEDDEEIELDMTGETHRLKLE